MKRGVSMKRILVFAVLAVSLLAVGCATTDTYARVGGRHLRLDSGTKQLFWFNGIHCSDPRHRMFDDIDREFRTFAPTCVLVEGGANVPSASRDEAIVRGGEPRYVAFLGFQAGVPVFDLEPSLDTQLALLTSKYPKSDVLAMYLIRQLYQKQREFRDNGIPIDVDQYLGSYVGRTPLAGLVPEGKSPRSLVEAHLGQSLSESWFTADYGSVIYFNTKPNVIHDIWRDTTALRDEYGAQRIADLSQKYERIFVMMGSDHIPKQRARLEQAYRARS